MKSKILPGIRHSWRWALLAGVAASIFSLMLGLLVQTGFYEIASSIPAVIRQDSHISLPVCNSFPKLYGCDPWVGKWTGLEILDLSVQVSQISGLVFNFCLIFIFSMWLTVRKRIDGKLPDLLPGIIGGISTLALALLFDLPLTIHAPQGIFGIVIISLFPLVSFSGAILGKKRLSKMIPHRFGYLLQSDASLELNGDGENLSKRELEVLALVAGGFENNEIAQQLYISNATVKTHLHHIYRKLGVRNRTAAVTKALACGWLYREDDFGFDQFN